MFIKEIYLLPSPPKLRLHIRKTYREGQKVRGSKSDVNFRKKKKKSFSSPFLKPNTFHPRNEPACTEKKQNEMTPNK